MKPFEDDSSVVSLADLSIENGKESVVIHGSLDIDRTTVGLDRARRLKAHVDSIVETLEAMDLPAIPTEAAPPKTISNPLLKG